VLPELGSDIKIPCRPAQVLLSFEYGHCLLASFYRAHAAPRGLGRLAPWPRRACGKFQNPGPEGAPAGAAVKGENTPCSRARLVLSERLLRATAESDPRMNCACACPGWLGSAQEGIGAWRQLNCGEYIDSRLWWLDGLAVRCGVDESFRLFSGRQALHAASSGFVPYRGWAWPMRCG